MKNALLMLLVGFVFVGCGSVVKGPETVSVRKPDNAAEIAELQKYVDDTTPSAPVYRPSSAVMCHGPKYVSSVGREARHLIEGIKKGIYPLSQCSTYDLQFSE